MSVKWSAKQAAKAFCLIECGHCATVRDDQKLASWLGYVAAAAKESSSSRGVATGGLKAGMTRRAELRLARGCSCSFQGN